MSPTENLVSLAIDGGEVYCPARGVLNAAVAQVGDQAHLTQRRGTKTHRRYVEDEDVAMGDEWSSQWATCSASSAPLVEDWLPFVCGGLEPMEEAEQLLRPGVSHTLDVDQLGL